MSNYIFSILLFNCDDIFLLNHFTPYFWINFSFVFVLVLCVECRFSYLINEDKKRDYDRNCLVIANSVSDLYYMSVWQKRNGYWTSIVEKKKRERVFVCLLFISEFNSDFKMLKMSVMLKIFHVISLIQYIYAIHYDLNYVLQQQKKLPEVSDYCLPAMCNAALLQHFLITIHHRYSWFDRDSEADYDF